MKKEFDEETIYMLLEAIALGIFVLFVPDNIIPIVIPIVIRIAICMFIVVIEMIEVIDKRELNKSRKELEDKKRTETQRWAKLTEEERERESLENARRESELRESKKRKNDIRNARLVIIKFLFPGFIFAGLFTQSLCVVGLGVFFTIVVSMLPVFLW